MDEVDDEDPREEHPYQDAQTEPRPARRHRAGLASIGNQLDLGEKFDHPFFESDEDERMVEILNSLECARMSLGALNPELKTSKIAKQASVAASRFQNLVLSIDLSLPNNKQLEDYQTVGDWLASLN